MITLVLAISLAILLSAMCSLFEAVLYSVPRSYVESFHQSGGLSGRLFKQLRSHVEKPIAAILSLNTIANTAGAAIAGAAVAKVFGSQWLGTFSALFTLSILLFSEVIPKTAGVVYNRRFVRIVSLPLHVLVVIFTPMIWICQIVTKLVAPHKVEEKVSEEELIMLTRLGLQTGTIEPDDAHVIQTILSLEKKYAKDIMAPRSVIFSLNCDVTVEDAQRKERFLEHSRIPVYDENEEDIVGIVYRRDILKSVADDHKAVKIAHIMKPVHFVREFTTLDTLLKKFLERREHMLLVLDAAGGLAGLVTLEDVLEEILGKEIVDEFDQVVDVKELAKQRRARVMDTQNNNP